MSALLRRRLFGAGYLPVQCALCYRPFRPWQKTIRGANYFPHPYMMCHRDCALAYVAARSAP